MTQKKLAAILDEHKIPDADRPAFRTLIEVGIILRPGFGKKVRGRYKKCFEAVLIEMSKPIIEKYSLNYAH
jgi:hypothetical protein